MFDIGFLEIIIIAVVGLLVIGPERLPEVARTAGRWLGRVRRFVGNVKADIDREIQQEEIKKALERDAGLDEIKQIMNTDNFSIEEEPDYIKAIEDVDQKAAYQQVAADNTQQDEVASTEAEPSAAKDNDK